MNLSVKWAQGSALPIEWAYSRGLTPGREWWTVSNIPMPVFVDLPEVDVRIDVVDAFGSEGLYPVMVWAFDRIVMK